MKDPEIPRSFREGIPVLCIDASSMIYHLKIGLLGSLAAEVRLLSTPQVFEEVLWPHLPIEPIALEEEGVSNDDSLLLLARREGIPLVSEDKEILMNAREEGLEYYNSLMMLNYLFLKGRVTLQDYPEYLDRLMECSRYSADVLAYGKAVYTLIAAQMS
ncbi:MAG: hypothetical protein PQJ58_02840 [Spirochaetales bacterium]|nr:hypothetical protein [Spirochaetales bacterium]